MAHANTAAAQPNVPTAEALAKRGAGSGRRTAHGLHIRSQWGTEYRPGQTVMFLCWLKIVPKL